MEKKKRKHKKQQKDNFDNYLPPKVDIDGLSESDTSGSTQSSEKWSDHDD